MCLADVPFPPIAAFLAHLAFHLPLATQGWTFAPGAGAWTAVGTMRGATCCTGWFEARRDVVLPDGGTVEVELTAPCGQAAAVWVGSGAAQVSAVGDDRFAGTLRLSVPPDPAPRPLVINVTGGLHCCGPVEVRAVRIRPTT